MSNNRTRPLTEAEAARVNGGTVGWINQRYAVRYQCPFCEAQTWRHTCNPPKKGSHHVQPRRYC